jgi:hypothetical protein
MAGQTMKPSTIRCFAGMDRATAAFLGFLGLRLLWQAGHAA